MKNKALIIFGILLLTSGVYASKSKKISVKVNNYNAKITSEEAKNLALNHSKVSKNLTKITKLMLGKENKKLVYEVEFTTLNIVRETRNLKHQCIEALNLKHLFPLLL